MEVLEAFVVRQACDLLQGLIPKRENEKESMLSKEHMERLYIFTLMWSLGAFFELEDRCKLENYMKNQDALKDALPKIEPDTDHTMFDYFVDDEGSFLIDFLVLFKALLVG